jgi:D-alanine--D-alanine ligase
MSNNKVIKIAKLRVGVFMGGKSIECEVSFNSGRTICDHLDTEKYEVIPIFQKDTGELFLLPWHFLHRGKIADFYDRLETEAKKICWDDLPDLIDFVYIACHGRFAEDGTLQGFLEVLGIPYLGAKVFGSALSMDKIVQKKILQAEGIKVAKEVVISAGQIKKLVEEKILKELDKHKINFPVVVKPAHEGSSFGVNVVLKKEHLLRAIKNASECDSRRVQDVLIEEKIEGKEFVCVSLKSKERNEWYSLPLTEVIPEKDTYFFDYIQKYMPGRATKIIPGRFTKEEQDKIINVCERVATFLQFSTISRIDGFVSKDGDVIIIDPNSLTGMGPATFLFHQAAEVGMSHTDLINYLIENELLQYGMLSITTKQEGKTKDMQNKNKAKTKVVVLLGGNTNEREISLESGRNICYKLSPNKYEVIPIFVDDDLQLFKLSQRLLIQNSTREIAEQLTKDLQVKWSDLPNICDFVFIGLHGGAGENGEIQGALEMLGIPYNGPGVLASALCMDKYRTTQFLKSQGFNVPNSFLINKKVWNEQKEKKEHLKNILTNFKFPLILKPDNDGCSMFVEKIKDESELYSRLNFYFKETGKDYALLEEFINGIELTCGVIGNEEVTVLPPSQVVSTQEILSIEEKFLPGAGQNLTPAPLYEKALDSIKDILERAYKVVGCKGYTRIDFFYQEEANKVIILEFNTLPGMTPATCIFHQAAEIGLRPMEFIDKIVELGMQQHAKVVESKAEVKKIPKNKKGLVQNNIV